MEIIPGGSAMITAAEWQMCKDQIADIQPSSVEDPLRCPVCSSELICGFGVHQQRYLAIHGAAERCRHGFETIANTTDLATMRTIAREWIKENTI
jgi:hypothetical protein